MNNIDVEKLVRKRLSSKVICQDTLLALCVKLVQEKEKLKEKIRVMPSMICACGSGNVSKDESP